MNSYWDTPKLIIHKIILFIINAKDRCRSFKSKVSDLIFANLINWPLSTYFNNFNVLSNGIDINLFFTLNMRKI